MRLEASDPDIETIVTRIDRGDIDLQPEFQRGEVWSKQKKQRLVDSILRDWHVPPVHVIEVKETHKQEVLDGQQRLAAIHDFATNNLTVNGNLEPIDFRIRELDGLTFAELPPEWKRRFNQFTIRVFRIVDYNPDEPGELFFRLNQPTSLTAAETRNAFFGPVRNQVKDLVDHLNAQGLDRDYLGFSNARMAFDDLMARVAVTVDRNTIARKVTANDLVEIYRQKEPLPQSTIARVDAAIDRIAESKAFASSSPRFNKATIYSWFLFVIRALAIDDAGLRPEELAGFELEFRNRREFESIIGGEENQLSSWLLGVYSFRSTARVADVSSVMLRDIIIWLEFARYVRSIKSNFPLTQSGIDKVELALSSWGDRPFDEEEVVRRAGDLGWGRLV